MSVMIQHIIPETEFYHHGKKHFIHAIDDELMLPVIVRDVYGNKSNTSYKTMLQILDNQEAVS